MPVLFTQLNPVAATKVIERLWLLKCQGRDSSLNLYHGPSLLGKSQLPCQGLSSQLHLLLGASPTAKQQQESRPRSTGGSVGVPTGQTCLAPLHCRGSRHRALSSIQHPHPASLNLLLPPLQWVYIYAISESQMYMREAILLWPQRSRWMRHLWGCTPSVMRFAQYLFGFGSSNLFGSHERLTLLN